jgi:hypothetical protein
LDEEKEQIESDPFMRQVGMRMIAPEGQYCYDARPEFFLEQFGAFVSEDVRAYLMLESDEIDQPTACDAALIGWAELAQRMRKWEQYCSLYPRSVLEEDAAAKWIGCLCFLLYGIDNSRIWISPQRELDPDLKRVYEKYVKDYPDSLTGQRIAEHYAVLKQFNFQWSPVLDETFMKNTGERPMRPYGVN